MAGGSTASALEKLTLAQLKEKCKAGGLPTTGLKEDLVRRLEVVISAASAIASAGNKSGAAAGSKKTGPTAAAGTGPKGIVKKTKVWILWAVRGVVCTVQSRPV